MSDMIVGQSGSDVFSTSSDDFVLPGVGPVSINKEESVSHKLMEEYKKWLEIIQQILNKPQGSTSESDVAKLHEAINALAKLAKEGDPTANPPSFMDNHMLDSLEFIFTLLKDADIVPNGPPPSFMYAHYALGLIKDYSLKIGDKKITIFSMLNDALNLSSDLVLQAHVRVFIKEANKILEAKMASLEQQLALTKEIADLLAQLQDIRNKHSKPHEVGDFPNTDPTASPIEVIHFTPEEIQELLDIKNKLNVCISKLQSQGVSVEDAGSLAEALKNVMDTFAEIDRFIPPGSSPPDSSDPNWLAFNKAIEQWVADRHSTPSEAGKNQDAINKAITASQALNDTQKEELREILYLYEQFVKIANELIQAMQKFMTSMAQAIAK